MVGGVLFTNQVPPVLPNWLSGHCPDFLRGQNRPKGQCSCGFCQNRGTGLDFAQKGRFLRCGNEIYPAILAIG